MDHPVVFSYRAVLAASVDAIGGTELVFVDVSQGGDLFQMQVSFSIPHLPGAGLMVGITGVGVLASMLWLRALPRKVLVLLLCVFFRRNTTILFLIIACFVFGNVRKGSTKLQNGRGALATVFSQSVELFGCIQSTFQFFGKKISSLRASGDGGSIERSAAACAAQLEMIYAQAIEGHTGRVEQFDEINDPSDLSALLVAAGFHVPANEADRIKLSGALEVILSSVASCHWSWVPGSYF